MSLQKKRWPGISISESDHELVDSIRKQDGLLRGINQKDLLMVAASLAVKLGSPEVVTETKSKQVTHPDLINKDDYAEYRQYIALIYYVTAAKRDLNSMSDTKIMVDNFLDYAHRGLQILKTEYLESKDGDTKIGNEFVSLLANIK
jgi:hypothetical protein